MKSPDCQAVARFWKELEDEAHNKDCVMLDVPLPRGTTAKDVRAELHLRRLQIFVHGKLFFDDSFAEEKWINLDDSYWEFTESAPSDTEGVHAAALQTHDGPLFRYFLMKNLDFQQEPLYCLFDTELLPPPDLKDEDCSDEGESADDDHDNNGDNNDDQNSRGCLHRKKEDAQEVRESPLASQEDISGHRTDHTEHNQSHANIGTKSYLGCNNENEEPSCAQLNTESMHGTSRSVQIALCALEAAGKNELLRSASPIRFWILEAGLGHSDGRCAGDALIQAGAAYVDIVIIRLNGAPTDSEVNLSQAHVKELDGRQRVPEELLEMQLPHLIHVPSSVIGNWYHSWAPFLADLVHQGVFLFLSEENETISQVPDTTVAEDILRLLGCNILVPCFTTPDALTKYVCCAQGTVSKDPPFFISSGKDADVADRVYVHARRQLTAKGLDFRPEYPHPGASVEPQAAAEAAYRAWNSMGCSRDGSAVAAGLTAGEVAISVMARTGTAHPNSLIQAAVSWGVRCTRKAGGAEHYAAAVGSLLGLREGLFAWDPRCPLDRHGAQVAEVVGMTLAGEDVWVDFSSGVRRQKIMEVTSAGGLRRPGECTIALCQALMGMNRPPGGKRAVAALQVLRQVSQILLAEAMRPNLLDPASIEAKNFWGVVQESLNLPRLQKMLDDHPEGS